MWVHGMRARPIVCAESSNQCSSPGIHAYYRPCAIMKCRSMQHNLKVGFGCWSRRCRNGSNTKLLSLMSLTHCHCSQCVYLLAGLCQSSLLCIAQHMHLHIHTHTHARERGRRQNDAKIFARCVRWTRYFRTRAPNLISTVFADQHRPDIRIARLQEVGQFLCILRLLRWTVPAISQYDFGKRRYNTEMAKRIK